MKEPNEDLFTLSEKLIKLLAVEATKSSVRKFWFDIIAELEDIKEYYKNNNDELGFAEIQAGLRKLFDFYSIRHFNNKLEIESIVSRIVFLSINMFPAQDSSKQFSNIGCVPQHEQGACSLGILSGKFNPHGKPVRHNSWPHLPADDAVNFIKPYPEILSTECHLFRIISSDGEPRGNWWFMKKCLPNTRKEWRANFAVLVSWNLDNYYVEFRCQKQLKVWAGIAAGYRVPKQKCILKGGETQFWISTQNLPKHLDINKMQNIRSDWLRM